MMFILEFLRGIFWNLRRKKELMTRREIRVWYNWKQFYLKIAGGWRVPHESAQEPTEKIAKLEIARVEIEKEQIELV